MGIIYFLIISIIAAKKGLACLSSFFYKALGVYVVLITLANLGRWSRYTEMYNNPDMVVFVTEALFAAVGGIIFYFIFYFIFKLLFNFFRK